MQVAVKTSKNILVVLALNTNSRSRGPKWHFMMEETVLRSHNAIYILERVYIGVAEGHSDFRLITGNHCCSMWGTHFTLEIVHSHHRYMLRSKVSLYGGGHYTIYVGYCTEEICFLLERHICSLWDKYLFQLLLAGSFAQYICLASSSFTYTV
ncbi:hypothetical protein XELAEV_18028767mg [Xenopus laevis]|uniref:Uncharacterized protein n=1 Tax=Xenopus laevis TaxID=8355 RepID=A0A974HGZ9_XENLA|nr:hypothetical protein XELAEV_18028767mg [Xenopus laevis]